MSHTVQVCAPPVIHGAFIEFVSEKGWVSIDPGAIVAVRWYNGPAADGRIVRSAVITLRSGATFKVMNTYKQIMDAIDDALLLYDDEVEHFETHVAEDDDHPDIVFGGD